MTLAAYYSPELAARSVTARAYDSLSTLSKSLLWYLDIEKLTLPDVCGILALSPAETIDKVAIARKELRFAWLAEQMADSRTPEMCKKVTQELSTTRALSQSITHNDETQLHLTVCLRCAILNEELVNLPSHLKTVLLPLVLGPQVM